MDDQGPNAFHRVDEIHPLDLYIGSDDMSRPVLFLISDLEPPTISSSQIISVSIGKRKDNKWGLSFTLLDNMFEDLFANFCTDIIESSRSLKIKNNGAAFICDRYEKWQNMLSKLRGGLLSPSIIKGLIGELFFLKDYIIPTYGQEKALNSWIGPDKADQDFVCDDIWYEVKSTVSGTESIGISSVEQLDMQMAGELVIVYLDRTSQSDTEKITLNSIFKEVSDSLSNEEMKHKLSGILLNFGYYAKPEYDGPAFKYSKTERYLVDNSFPCVRRNNLPNAVINSNYDLSISAISNYRREQ